MSNKKAKIIIIVIASLVLALCVASASVYYIMKPKTEPAGDLRPVISALVTQSRSRSGGDVLSVAAADELSCRISGAAEQKYRRAWQELCISYLDIDALTADIAPEMQEKLAVYVENAFEPSDVYDEDGNYQTKLIDNAYSSVIMSRLKNSYDYVRSQTITVALIYSDGKWQLEDDEELKALLDISIEGKPGYDEACSRLSLVSFHYMLDDWTSAGPAPDKNAFGQTDDPAVINALLSTAEAQNLMNGQTSVWSAQTQLLPETGVSYYLDETILALTWQEETRGGVGTFSEVFVGDASQLRRKIAGDIFACYEFYPASALAAESNAVIAINGDMYDVPDTVHGVYAYNGKARWVNLREGQTCFFTASGDMLFAFENQFSSEAEVQRFMDENAVMFSASYGPVLIADGVDITPEYYALGEINSTYARSCIGQLGSLHYLMMTLNAVEPGYNVYFTVKQAAQVMAEKGCIQAYTLAGGHNAELIMDNKVMNPVQFGYEKYVSDIIYFATALK